MSRVVRVIALRKTQSESGGFAEHQGETCEIHATICIIVCTFEHRSSKRQSPTPPNPESAFLQATNAPIFRLPGKKVHQRRERLAYKTEADPKYTIPNHPAIDPLHLLQRRREIDHR